MVEQWSSKSHAWVRFLLSLIATIYSKKKNSYSHKPQHNRGKPYVFDKFRKFRPRPFKSLFHTFKNKKINLKHPHAKVWQQDHVAFFFTRSLSFLNQTTLSHVSIRFEVINTNTFWLKTLFLNVSNSLKTPGLVFHNFFFNLRYSTSHFKFIFMSCFKYCSSLLCSSSIDFKRKYLEFLNKNSFWLFRVFPYDTACKNLVNNSLITNVEKGFKLPLNARLQLFSNEKITTNSGNNFTTNLLPTLDRHSSEYITSNERNLQLRRNVLQSTFWGKLLTLKRFKNNFSTKQSPSFIKKKGFPSYLYLTAWPLLVRYYKRQVPQRTKKTLITPYFHMFDAYIFSDIDLLEVTPRTKNWNFADLRVSLVDKMFYIVFVGNTKFSTKHAPCAVKLSYDINNAFFENKYSMLLRKNYVKIKLLFSRQKNFRFFDKKPIPYKKKKPRRALYVPKWKTRRKVKIVIKRTVVKVLGGYRAKPRNVLKPSLSIWNTNSPSSSIYYTFSVKNILFSISNARQISNLFSHPLLFKFFLTSLLNFVSIRKLSIFYTKKIENMLLSTIFYDRYETLPLVNLSPHPTFFHLIEKRLLRVDNIVRFQANTTPWHFHTIVRFFEFCTGKKVVVKLFSFVSNLLTFSEKSQCLIWSYRVKEFRKKLGTPLFLNESLQVVYIALKLKDPFFLSDWLTKMFQRISFWKFRTLFRYMKYVLRYFFFPEFSSLDVKGVKIQLKGKISAAGNSRKRTIRYKIGQTGNSTMNNKTLTILSRIPTFTGVQGFKIWFTF